MIRRLEGAKLICLSDEPVQLLAPEAQQQIPAPAPVRVFEWTTFGQMRIRIARAHGLLAVLARLPLLKSRAFLILSSCFAAIGLTLGIRLLVIEDMQTLMQRFPWHIGQVVVLLFLIFLVTAIHELGHAVVCTFLGVPVRSMGIMLYYLQPAAYADITDSWLLRNKWHRVLISSAGLYVQSLVTSLAVFLAIALRAAHHRSDLLLVFIVMNLFTIAFNFVPFVKLDGYWILSAAIAVPNLRDRAMEWWRVVSTSFVTRRPINEKTLRYNAVLQMTPLGKSLLACFGLTATIFGTAMWLGGLAFLFRLTRWLNISPSRSYLAVAALLLTVAIVFVLRLVQARRRPAPVAAQPEQPRNLSLPAIVTYPIDRERIVRLNPYATVIDPHDGTLVFGWSAADQLVIRMPAECFQLIPALRQGIRLCDLVQAPSPVAAQTEQLLQRLWHLKHLRYASDWEIEAHEQRYARQLGWFSMNVAARGSETTVLSRLRGKTVAILGVGGLGTHIAWNLAACGVGNLHLIDGDTVELSNLNRQLLYTPADVGRSKVEVAAEKLKLFNPDLEIRTSQVFLHSVKDVLKVIDGADFVVRSLDTPQEIQILVNEACVRLSIPCSGAGFLAQGAVIGPTVIPGDTACLACNLDPKLPRIDRGAGATLAPVVTICAGILANEVISFLADLGPLRTAGGMLMLDAPTFSTQFHEIARDAACTVCGQRKGVAV